MLTLAVSVLYFLGTILSVICLINGMCLQVTYPFLRYFSLSFRLDPLASFFIAIILIVAFFAWIFSRDYLRDTRSFNRWTQKLGFFLLVVAMGGVVLADHLFTLLFFWEWMSLTSLILVITEYSNKATRQASWLYFIFTQMSALALFAACGWVYVQTGRLDFQALGLLSLHAKYIALVLFFIGFGIKAGVFPFHVWLPYAHSQAPSYVSALMSGVMIKTGVYGLIRVYQLLDIPSVSLGFVVLGLGVISGFMGIIYALIQRDIKRMLAYCSIENIGIIFMGLGLGIIGQATGNHFMAVLGFLGALVHIFNHALLKTLLFLASGIIQHTTHTRLMDQMGGLLRSLRVTGAAFLVGGLAISGLPLFNGFISEFLIYFAAFKGFLTPADHYMPAVISILCLAVIGGVALTVFTKAFGVMFLGEPRQQQKTVTHHAGIWMLVPLVVISALSVFIGLFPEPLLWCAAKALQPLHLIYSDVAMAAVMALFKPIRLALLVLLLFGGAIMCIRLWLVKRRGFDWTMTWGCGFSYPKPKMQYSTVSFSHALVRFFRFFVPQNEMVTGDKEFFPQKGRVVFETEDAVERYVMHPIGRFSEWVLEPFRRIQHGNIHLYVVYILIAIVALMIYSMGA